jgi:hypothetical protein
MDFGQRNSQAARLEKHQRWAVVLLAASDRCPSPYSGTGTFIAWSLASGGGGKAG